ncbi:MAG: lysylphosphatidylglycerol synthase transmembrane domain-containing protein [Panacagrimonas sp.]
MSQHVINTGSQRKRVLVALAGLGMVAYLTLAVITDYAAIERAMKQLGFGGVALILGLSMLNYLLRFARWHWYLRDQGYALPWLRHGLVYLGGFLFTVSPAKAGEAMRSVYLHEQGVRYADSFAALFVERLLDVLAYALLASLIAFQQPQYRGLLLGVLVLGLALLLLSGHPALPRMLDRLAASHQTQLSKLAALLANLLRSSKQMLRPTLLLPGLMIGLIAWGVEGIGFHLICAGLALDVPPMTATSVYAIAGLAGAATFFMPGGIGGMEVVMTALLTAMGAPLALAVVATLLCRLATLWFAVLIGLIATVLLELSPLRQPAAQP